MKSIKFIFIICLFFMTSCSNQKELDNNKISYSSDETIQELVTFDDEKIILNKGGDDVIVSYECGNTELYNIDYPFSETIYNSKSDIKLFENDFSLILKDLTNSDTVYLIFENNNEMRIIYNQKEMRYFLEELPFKNDVDNTIKEAYLKGNNYPLSILINSKLKGARIYLFDYTFGDENQGVELIFKDDGLKKFLNEIKNNTLEDYVVENDGSKTNSGKFISECQKNEVSIVLDYGLNKTILTDGLCNKVDAEYSNGSSCSYLSNDIKISEYIYDKAKECVDIAMMFNDANHSTYLMPLHFENDEIIIKSNKGDYPRIPYILNPDERVKNFKEYGLKAYIDDIEVNEISLIDDKKPHEIIFKDINNNEYLYIYQYE